MPLHQCRTSIVKMEALHGIPTDLYLCDMQCQRQSRHYALYYYRCRQLKPEVMLLRSQSNPLSLGLPLFRRAVNTGRVVLRIPLQPRCDLFVPCCEETPLAIITPC